MLPDLAISRCDLSNPFPAPGSRVRATVEVSNLGLAGSAVDSRGRSPVGVHAKYIGQDGTERFVWRESVSEIPPGALKRYEFTLELPLIPGRSLN